MAMPDDVDGLNALVERMMATTGGLERQLKRKAKGRKLKKPLVQCWEGSEAVTWVANNFACSRAEAVAIMQQLVDGNLVRNAVEATGRAFADDGDVWRFWADGTAPPLNVRVVVHRSVAVRAPLVVVRCLLDHMVRAVLPYVRVTTAALELDYYRLRETRAWADLDVGVCELQRLSLQSFASDDEAVVFWILLYNLLALHSSVCNKGLVAGGWHGGFFVDSVYLLCDGTATLSLFQLHNGILRQNSRINPLAQTPFERNDPLLKLAVRAPDPRVLFALCGCFKDSPALRAALDVTTLNATLNTATAEYLDEYTLIDVSNCVVTLPGLMAPFVRDFGKGTTCRCGCVNAGLTLSSGALQLGGVFPHTLQDNSAVLSWVSRYLPTERRQLLLFLAQQEVTTVRFGDVNFDVNAPRIASRAE